MSGNRSKIRTFQNLKVWKCARRIQRLVAQIVKKFPNYEEYRLKDQMIRSSRSIARNIAEGLAISGILKEPKKIIEHKNTKQFTVLFQTPNNY